LPILDKILLISISKNYVPQKQHLQELLTLFYKLYMHLEKNQFFLHMSIGISFFTYIKGSTIKIKNKNNCCYMCESLNQHLHGNIEP
jgi:hypothetical protein